jgi:hypothetical protein
VRSEGDKKRDHAGVLFCLESCTAFAVAHDGLHKREEPVCILGRRDWANFVLQKSKLLEP